MKKEFEIRDEEALMADVEIIKPYLVSKGYNLSFEPGDVAGYIVSRKGDKIYLSFEIDINKGYGSGGKKIWDTTCGQIVYNDQGEVLIDVVEEPGGDFRRDPNYIIKGKAVYEEIDPATVFVGESTIIRKCSYFKTGEKGLGYYVYTPVDGEIKIEKFKIGSQLLRTANDTIIINNNGSLYNVNKNKFLKLPEFENRVFKVYDSTCDFKDITAMFKHNVDYGTIYDIILMLQKKNLLLTYNRVSSSIGEGDNYCQMDADAFMFIDPNGSIVSKLYVYCEDLFDASEVNKKDYEKTLKTVEDMLHNKLEKKRRAEKRKLVTIMKLRNKAKSELGDAIETEYNYKCVPKRKRNRNYI